MLTATILGSSNAVPDENHDNTHLAITSGERNLLIDCSGSPLVRLQKAGLDANQVSDLILTHFHPDHIAGVPSLLMQSWLTGRHSPLNIYGLGHVLERMKKLLELYEWTLWPEMYPVYFHTISDQGMTPVIQDQDFHVFAAQVCHMIPCIGLRIESPETKAVLAYSTLQSHRSTGWRCRLPAPRSDRRAAGAFFSQPGRRNCPRSRS
jgi:ribonuclease Z